MPVPAVPEPAVPEPAVPEPAVPEPEPPTPPAPAAGKSSTVAPPQAASGATESSKAGSARRSVMVRSVPASSAPRRFSGGACRGRVAHGTPATGGITGGRRDTTELPTPEHGFREPKEQASESEAEFEPNWAEIRAQAWPCHVEHGFSQDGRRTLGIRRSRRRAPETHAETPTILAWHARCSAPPCAPPLPSRRPSRSPPAAPLPTDARHGPTAPPSASTVAEDDALVLREGGDEAAGRSARPDSREEGLGGALGEQRPSPRLAVTREHEIAVR